MLTDFNHIFIDTLQPGTEVEVRNHFRHAWTTGFAVASRDGDRIRLRRLSDGAILPVSFEFGEVRTRR